MATRNQLLLTLTLGVGLGAGAMLSTDGLLPTAQAERARAPEAFNPTRSFAPLVAELSPAVVNIEVSRTVEAPQGLDELRQLLPPGFPLPEGLDTPRVQEGSGSGFIISPDGYLLTNHHVVDGSDEVVVRLLDERELTGRVIGSDDSLDIALIKIDAGEPLPYVELGDSEAARVGDWVLAIGNPFGLSHTVTVGIISAKGRVIGAGPYDNFIQTDAAINPGNSGGPLFNLDGEVVGINTAINPMAQGVGFSVPVNEIRRVVEDLRDDGRVSRGWLGVGLSGGEGAVVSAIYPNTPAADAGLEVGDRIVSLEGKDVDDSDALVRAIGRYRAGDALRLGIDRDGRSERLTVTLGERPTERDLRSGSFRQSPPEAVPEVAPEAPESPPRLGVTLQPLSALGIDSDEGVIVTGIRKGSAAYGHLQPGDIILSVEGEPVATPQDVAAHLIGATQRLKMVISRGDEERLVMIPLR
ncbi:MAG: serine protease Do [Myxococcota bacterium]|jgi:serine protease Do